MAASIWRLSLPENKAHQERLRQELRDAGVYPETHADLSLVQKLPFLTNVLRETLRLDSPIPADLPRVVKKGQDVTIMGVKIEPGVRPDLFCVVYLFLLYLKRLTFSSIFL